MVVGVYPIKLDLKFMLHHRADKMLGTSFLLEFGLNSGLETRVCDQVWLCKIACFLRSLPPPKNIKSKPIKGENMKLQKASQNPLKLLMGAIGTQLKCEQLRSHI